MDEAVHLPPLILSLFLPLLFGGHRSWQHDRYTDGPGDLERLGAGGCAHPGEGAGTMAFLSTVDNFTLSLWQRDILV